MQSVFTRKHLVVNRLNNWISYLVDINNTFVQLTNIFKIKNYEKIIFIVSNELNLYF